MSGFLKFFIQTTRRIMKNSDDRFLVVVCGCTGTGKSDLGIEIAKRFHGEVISSDSMQIYRGLDIVTNKVTQEEMQDVPHHMMSFYDPHKSDYNVHKFREQALQIMDKIWSDGKLPVIVGGTSYYVESILYKNYLIPSNSAKNDALWDWLETNHPTNDDLYKLLKQVDPESAKQVHRNNRYRVLRALEIFYSTGKRKSEHIREQQAPSVIFDILGCDNKKFGGELRFKNTLLLNLDADKEVLDKRLDKRVDKMVQNGLLRELEEFYDNYGPSVKDHGILQSIGLKEFLPYLSLDDDLRRSPRGQKLFQNGCELLKLHTRQYCRKQRNWIYQRILLRSGTREVPECVSFNSSRNFFDGVVPQALRIVDNFLSSRPVLHDIDVGSAPFMPPPDNAEAIRNKLTSNTYDNMANLIYNCDCCGIEVHGEQNWRTHLSGRRHRKAKAAASKQSTNVE